MSHNPFAVVQDQTKAVTSSVKSGGVPASKLYPATIKVAYMIPNNFNSKNTDLVMEIELDSGYTYQFRKTVLIDGKPTSINKKTKKEELNYGYQLATHIIGAAIEGKTLGDIWDSVAKKSVSIYDFEKRADVIQEVPVVGDLKDKAILIGLQRKIANKRQKDETTDEWVDLPERKETLEFGCAGSPVDRRTFTEFMANVGAEEPAPAVELDKWEKQNTGKDWDAYKEVGAANGVPEAVAQGGANAGGAVHDFGS